MNAVFTAIIVIGVSILLVSSPESTLLSFINGSKSGVDLAVKLFCIYAVWLSILKLWSKLNFDDFLGKKLNIILKKVFPHESEDCYKDLAVNVSANLLGMGSAGTPAGMKAIAEMKEKRNKVMLLVVNSTSIQLIPTTIVALRSARGATADVILPTLLSTLATTLIGMLLVKIFIK